MADIILVQPEVGDWDSVRSHPSLPLGLLSAASLAAKTYETVLIDTRIDRHWRQRLKDELGKNPVCLGLTSMTGRQIHYALEVSRFVRSVSSVPIVWGGIHGSLLPETTAADKNIDILVIGEGELSFYQTVKALADKSSLDGIYGIWYKKNNKIIRNPNSKFIELDSLPRLPLSLLDINKYLPVFKGRRTFYIETSRGCPNQCGFCYNMQYNKNSWRAFSATRVIDDLKYISEHFNVKSFYIIDDNFFVDIKRALAIAKGIINARLDIFWEVQGITIGSALKMDDDYLRTLTRAGMKKVHFGVETASETMLKLVNKRINIKDVVEINKKWGNHDIVIQYNFMCGFPGESLNDIRKTRNLIFRLMKDNQKAIISPLCPYTPYPGTMLYDRALANGFIQKNTLEEWQEADYGDNIWNSSKRGKLLSSLFFSSMFLDKHRSRDMVQSRILKILIELYRPLARFRVKYLFFNFMPELIIKDLYFRVQKNMRLKVRVRPRLRYKKSIGKPSKNI